MGIDVGGEHFTHTGWRWVLNLAIEYGWQPAGTEPPDYGWLLAGTASPDGNDRSWDGGYCSNDFQKVTESDARALGEALLRAVAVLDAQEREKPTKWPDDWLRRVSRFADFALKGEFVIHLKTPWAR